MSAHAGIDERPVVVRVRETISSALVGHEGLEYQSPPQPRAEALALVRLLLGRGGALQDGEVSWRCPIAGASGRSRSSRCPSSTRPSGSAARGSHEAVKPAAI